MTVMTAMTVMTMTVTRMQVSVEMSDAGRVVLNNTLGVMPARM